MKSQNPSVLNHEVQKYVNDIIKKVYKVPAESLGDLATVISTATSTNGCTYIESSVPESKFSIKSVVNGMDYSVITLMKNYLKNFRQTSMEAEYELPLNGNRVIGRTISSGSVYNSINMDGHLLMEIPVPDGYDGNLAYVKVTIDKELDPTDSGTYPEHADLITILDSIVAAESSLTDATPDIDAAIYYAPDLQSGEFGISVAKSTKSIMVTVNTSGLTSQPNFDDTPNAIVKVTYFRRGVK